MTPPSLDAQNFDGERQHWRPVRIYYEDTDFTGVVYHANYLKYFERGRSDMLRDAGVSHQELLNRDDPAAFAILRMEIDYLQAARVEEEIWVCTRFLGMKGARFFFQQSALRDGQIITRAEVTGAMITPDGRPRRPVREIAAKLEPFVYHPVQS